MKFEFIWPSGFWENCVFYIDGNPKWVTLAERSLVNLELDYSHSLIRLNIGFPNFKNALWSKFGLDIK